MDLFQICLKKTGRIFLLAKFPAKRHVFYLVAVGTTFDAWKKCETYQHELQEPDDPETSPGYYDIFANRPGTGLTGSVKILVGVFVPNGVAIERVEDHLRGRFAEKAALKGRKKPISRNNIGKWLPHWFHWDNSLLWAAAVVLAVIILHIVWKNP